MQKKTFAEVFHNTCDVPLSQLPTPCTKSNLVTVQVAEDNNLVGLTRMARVILNKCHKPYTLHDLGIKQSLLWKSLGNWKAIPLGKGFFVFTLSPLEDMHRALAIGI